MQIKWFYCCSFNSQQIKTRIMNVTNFFILCADATRLTFCMHFYSSAKLVKAYSDFMISFTLDFSSHFKVLTFCF